MRSKAFSQFYLRCSSCSHHTSIYNTDAQMHDLFISSPSLGINNNYKYHTYWYPRGGSYTDTKSQSLQMNTHKKGKRNTLEISFLCPYWPAEIANLSAICAVPSAVSLYMYVFVRTTMNINLCYKSALWSTCTQCTQHKTQCIKQSRQLFQVSGSLTHCMWWYLLLCYLN